MKNGLITKKTITILAVLLLVGGCSSTPTDNTTTTKVLIPVPKLDVKPALPVNDGMFDGVYHSWKGTPYHYGGSSKKGIDCSAFVQVGYSSVYQKSLPRTTSELAQKGHQIKRNKAKEGDLVFLKLDVILNSYMHHSQKALLFHD